MDRFRFSHPHQSPSCLGELWVPLLVWPWWSARKKKQKKKHQPITSWLKSLHLSRPLKSIVSRLDLFLWQTTTNSFSHFDIEGSYDNKGNLHITLKLPQNLQCSWSSFTATQTHSWNDMSTFNPYLRIFTEMKSKWVHATCHHTTLFCILELQVILSVTHLALHKHQRSGLICCSEFCITSRVSSDRQKEITAQRSVSCERVSTPEWVKIHTLIPGPTDRGRVSVSAL